MKCEVCGQEIRSESHRRLHALTHVEKRSANLNVRMQPSKLEALRRVASQSNTSLTEVVDHAVSFTYHI